MVIVGREMCSPRLSYLEDYRHHHVWGPTTGRDLVVASASDWTVGVGYSTGEVWLPGLDSQRTIGIRPVDESPCLKRQHV